ncbi:hypothetical protein [Streptomyces sp. CB02400]|uniref:hypothetical protein n=1 Tax=Streptomyces sp. CB02400 TaxID=1703944 RepID=UPI000938EF0E|nr:hypothetical protein [Streptomyces sp. CB02400]OKJ89745.1 hypothetical protein AMK33_36705 [Streptomyces sp. CB02400]
MVGALAGLSLMAASPAFAAEISGYSRDGCQYAHGSYSYTLQGELGGYPTYAANYRLTAYDECDGDGQGSRLQVTYYEWYAGWRWKPWTTIAASGQTAGAYLDNVHEVQFRICEYTTAQGIHGCEPVS